jgi:hypothetical protein
MIPTMTLIEKIMLALGRLLSWNMPSTDSEIVPILPSPEIPKNDPLAIDTGLKTAISAPETPSKATLYNFCLAIRDFEGKPGNQNYRLNNPGNCRWNPSGYMPMYGKVGKSKNGFAIFSTYDLGWLYLMNMIHGQIHKRPNATILEFMTRYAPPEDDNNPKIYSNFIAKRLGVDNSFVVGKLG